MDQQDPNQESGLDPRAVPVAVASLAVIVLGVVLTYANTTFGALIVLLGLFGLVWVGRLAVKRDT
jgi:Flp pilus assembly protein TadB